MSNSLAIATVTATLLRLLQDALNAAATEEPGAVSGAKVTSVCPDGPAAGTPKSGINIYLYQAVPNTTWRNADLPTRRSDGSLADRPQIALDLHYLLSFYGDEKTLEPQRMLGVAVRLLNSRPILARKAIRDTVADPLYGYLTASDLVEQPELVRLTPIGMTLEEMSRLWSIFFQQPYKLSLVYMASVVVIESTDTVRQALPVRTPKVYVTPIRIPVVDQVLPATGPGQPVLANSTLVITGHRLLGQPTWLRVAGQDFMPDELSDTRIEVALTALDAASLRAGVQAVQVVHPAMLGEPAVEHAGVSSNVAPFVLSPQIKQQPGTGNYLIEKAGVTGSGNGPYGGNITVQVEPPIGRDQRVSLLLNQIGTFTGPPHAYSFSAPGRDPDTEPEASESVQIPFKGVHKGTYLVQVQIDGAASPLEIVSGEYAKPALVIP